MDAIQRMVENIRIVLLKTPAGSNIDANFRAHLFKSSRVGFEHLGRVTMLAFEDDLGPVAFRRLNSAAKQLSGRRNLVLFPRSLSLSSFEQVAEISVVVFYREIHR